MTTDDLARLRSEYDDLASTATPGPWWADSEGFGTIFRGTSYEDSRGDTDWLYDPRDATNDDAALIVWLRNNADALLDAAEASGRYRAAITAIHDRRHPSCSCPRDAALATPEVRTEEAVD